jgi:hypothetical protein
MSTPSEVITNQLGRLFRQVIRSQAAAVPHAAANGKGSELRASKGLRQFCTAIKSPEGLKVLDLGAASQANVNFITGLGHGLCTEDLHRCLELYSQRSMVTADPAPEVERFFRENLQYQPGQFDGILCWDLLDFVPDALVKPLVERIHQLLKPGGSLLTFFHSGQPGQVLPVCQYRILSLEQLQVSERAQGKLRRAFNNRGIESLFREYASLKFFLTKDSLREVVVVR